VPAKPPTAQLPALAAARTKENHNILYPASPATPRSSGVGVISGHGLSGVLRAYEGDRLPPLPEQLNPSPTQVRELRAALLDFGATGGRAGSQPLPGRRMTWATRTAFHSRSDSLIAGVRCGPRLPRQMMTAPSCGRWCSTRSTGGAASPAVELLDRCWLTVPGT
jgi:hypothetical protein